MLGYQILKLVQLSKLNILSTPDEWVIDLSGTNISFKTNFPYRASS